MIESVRHYIDGQWKLRKNSCVFHGHWQQGKPRSALPSLNRKKAMCRPMVTFAVSCSFRRAHDDEKFFSDETPDLLVG
jgi:hypothetical protein